MTGRQRRVLVAEDEPLARSMTERVLTGFGYEVTAVSNGAEAVAAHGSGSFDAVVMDCQMPVMDGFRATAAIRAHDEEAGRPHVPIIGLSGRNMEGDRDIALGKGMDEYLTKPVSASRLRAALAACIGTDDDAGGPDG